MKYAFGLLKGPWRIFQKQLNSNIALTNQIIIDSCVLHNFCIQARDLWDDDDDGNDADFPVREGYAEEAHLRDILKEYEDVKFVKEPTTTTFLLKVLFDDIPL